MTSDRCLCWKPTEPQIDCPLHRAEAAARRRPTPFESDLAEWSNDPTFDAEYARARSTIDREGP